MEKIIQFINANKLRNFRKNDYSYENYQKMHLFSISQSELKEIKEYLKEFEVEEVIKNHNARMESRVLNGSDKELERLVRKVKAVAREKELNSVVFNKR